MTPRSSTIWRKAVAGGPRHPSTRMLLPLAGGLGTAPALRDPGLSCWSHTGLRVSRTRVGELRPSSCARPAARSRRGLRGKGTAPVGVLTAHRCFCATRPAVTLPQNFHGHRARSAGRLALYRKHFSSPVLDHRTLLSHSEPPGEGRARKEA